MRSFVLAAIAAGTLAVACAPKSAPPADANRRRRRAAAAPPRRRAPATAAAGRRAARSAAAGRRRASRPLPAAAADPAAGAARVDAAAAIRRRRRTPPPAVMPAPVTPIVSATAPSPDPRVGLSPGRWDAGQAAWNLKLVSTTPPSEKFLGVTNSDLAFTGKYTIQGNYNGFQVFDISNPAKPAPVLTYVCPASQSDVSVYKNLLFVSGEGQTGRVDCGIQGVPEPVSKDRLRGIRIFDIADIANPKYRHQRADLPRLAHAHRRHRSERQEEHLHLCVGLGARAVGGRAARLHGRPDRRSEHGAVPPRSDPGAARGAAEGGDRQLAAHLQRPRAAAPPGRAGSRRRGAPAARRRGARRVPRAAARAARRRAGRGAGGRWSAAAGAGAAAAAARRGPPSGPNQCHDITVYPDIGLAGGACGGYGLLLDIREVAHPIRIDAAADINMSFWHSATFSNDGTKVLFTDEWGGGTQPRCRETDKLRVGRQRALHDREEQDGVQELLQDAGGADLVRELRRAQRLADPDPRPRGHGPGLVSGRASRCSTGPTSRSRRRSPTSTAARSTPPA